MTGDRVAEVLTRLHTQRDLLQAVARELDTMLVRVSSRDGSIEAEVDGRGGLTGLTLTERAYERGPEGVAAGIVAAAGAAARLAAARQSELVTLLSTRIADGDPNGLRAAIVSKSTDLPTERIYT